MGPEAQLTISLKAMQRSRTTLEDFALSYLPYLDLSPETHFFKYLDVLVWLEATIYQLDEDNEAMCKSGNQEPIRRLAEESCIRAALEQLSLCDSRVLHELRQADVYWGLERQLTAKMLALGIAPREPGAGGGGRGSELALDVAEVMQAHEAKSFDYRLLFLVLHLLVAAPYNDALLQFLRVDERLVDIGDDLTDYEDDVEANSFNIFRAFVFLYGKDAQFKLIELISELEAAHAKLLAQLPQHLQDHYWRRHTQASAEPGSGRWCFPPPIFDEASFRRSLAAEGA